MMQQGYKKSTKAAHQEWKQELSLKNSLFSRYLLFRYSLALFFFTNLYWLLPFIYKPSIYFILPVSMLVLIVLACAEQFQLYGAKDVCLERTKRALQAQIFVVLLVLVISVFPKQLPLLVPFFSNQLSAHLFLVLLQFIGLSISCYNLKRIGEIKRNADKFYDRFHKHIAKYS
ncbi:hypothetical protein [Streptococcus macacae]|uniref:PTS transporter n=1 Tax=Streptococcus macacae NCTC 11558 TaxID=764298 RepID=G5JYJ4_9STRE|nr:hypothetical protein [Streptococcus macacae]EHJ53169.1 hypothetical protein STRMA_0255 [Streptococcus macacae NCTC 11558]SUN78106.1 PTS transporter [Streptococcus macacae NCTC 11558]